MLLVAKQHADIKALVRSDACFLPFREHSFDVVYTSCCIVNVLSREMQQSAIGEVFRVASPDGLVILIENFEEPVARMNTAKERYRAAAKEIDQHNLHLNLDHTVLHARELGWHPVSVRGNTLVSFVAHVVVPRLIHGRGAARMHRLLTPVYVLLSYCDDYLYPWLPLFGKDTMVDFKRS